jgi:hypothetical protein
LSNRAKEILVEPIVSPIDPEENEKLDVVDTQEEDIQESQNELSQLIELESIEEPVSKQRNRKTTLIIIGGGVLVGLLGLVILFLLLFRPITVHRFKVKYFLLVSWIQKRIDSIKNIKVNWKKRKISKNLTQSELSTVDVEPEESDPK